MTRTMNTSTLPNNPVENLSDPSPTIIVVDDDAQVRRSLQSLLQSVGFKVETFASAAELSDRDLSAIHGCLLLDMRLPDRSGLEILEDPTLRRLGLPTIIITAFGDVSSAVRAFKHDAFDFIEKPFNDQYLIGRIQHAIQLDGIRRQVRDSITHASQQLDGLTAREAGVLDLIVSGMSNKMIAAQLGLAHKTIDNYRARIMQKMDAQNSADLVRKALIAKIKTAQGMPPYRIYEELFPLVSN